MSPLLSAAVTAILTWAKPRSLPALSCARIASLPWTASWLGGIRRVKRHNSRTVSGVIFLLPSRGASGGIRLVGSRRRNRDQRQQHHDESPAYNRFIGMVSPFSESTEILLDGCEKPKYQPMGQCIMKERPA
jgi:hypothetical protein